MDGLCPGCLLRGALNEEDDPDGLSEGDPAGLEPGTHLGPFRIGRLIGKGGMAAVYEAHEAPPLERTVALKVLPPEFLHDETFARRFAREARVIASLEHPGIVPVYASGIDDGIPWISMRLLTGGSLGTLLQQGPPGVERTTGILERLADAIDYAHARGVMHRDIKPSNILLDDAGRAYVCDFGLARLVMSGERWTRSGGLLGTPHYMAPEQAVSGNVDERCDIYSLGVVAYEMLTGTTPFDGDTPLAVLMQHATAPVPATLRDHCPESMSLAVEKALAKDPGDRWPSAQAFVGALGADVPRHARSGQWIRVTAAAAVTLTVAGAGACWFARDTPEAQQVDVIGLRRDGDIRLPLDDRRQGEVPNTGSKAGKLPPSAEEQTAPNGGPISEPPPSGIVVGQGTPELYPIDPPTPPRQATQPAPGETQGGGKPAPETPTANNATVPPKVRVRESPSYPSALKELGVQGTVRVEVDVGPDGSVLNARVLRKLHSVLDEEALKAVRQYKYEPGTRNGIADRFTVEESVTFVLTDP